MISDFGMRISDCKNGTKSEHGLRLDFGDRAKFMSKKSSSHLSIALKSALRDLKFAIMTGAMLLALCFSVEAQQPTKISRIGYLGGVPPSANEARIEAFGQGLRELGYVEGKNIVIEWRSSEGKTDRLPGLAAELVRLKVDVIVTGGSPATRSAREATVTIPIVMTQDGDPVGSGFVASLARPGG